MSSWKYRTVLRHYHVMMILGDFYALLQIWEVLSASTAFVLKQATTVGVRLASFTASQDFQNRDTNTFPSKDGKNEKPGY